MIVDINSTVTYVVKSVKTPCLVINNGDNGTSIAMSCEWFDVDGNSILSKSSELSRATLVYNCEKIQKNYNNFENAFLSLFSTEGTLPNLELYLNDDNTTVAVKGHRNASDMWIKEPIEQSQIETALNNFSESIVTLRNVVAEFIKATLV